MLVIDAYFDETGHGEDPNIKILGIAGCLAAAETWKKVESKWRAVLKAEGLPYFHMKEYAPSVGPFTTWKGDEARRRKVYGSLWEIILDANLIPLGGFVQLEDYKQELQGQDHHILKDAYFLCYLQCLGFVAQYIDFDAVSNVSTFFDDKEGFRGEAFRIYDQLKHHFREKIPLPVFRNMRQFLPLQVADIVAYETKKEFERRLFTPEAKARWGFDQLEKLISKSAPDDEPVLFGSQDCPIALLSKEELTKISTAQRAVYDDELD